jgi:hypothetical protein
LAEALDLVAARDRQNDHDAVARTQAALAATKARAARLIDAFVDGTLDKESFGELASSAQQSYLLGNRAARREMAIRLCANRSVAGKKVSVEPHFALRVLANRRLVTLGDPHYDATRTLVKDAWRLYRWAERWLKRNEKTNPALTRRVKQL